MEEHKKQSLIVFANNEIMVEAVYDVLYEFFHKRKDTKDVYLLATERMSQNLFDEAWRMVLSYKRDTGEKPEPKQVGL